LYSHNPLHDQKGRLHELGNLIVQETGILAEAATTIVNMVIDFLKKKLPAPVGAQIDGLLSRGAAVKTGESALGNLASKFGKKE
jgi:hypothetical protein